MKYFLVLLACCVSISGVEAQGTPDPVATDISSVADSLSIANTVQLFIDSTGSLEPEKALDKAFGALNDFSFRRRIPPKMIPFSYFLKFNLVNNASVANNIYFYPGSLFSKFKLLVN